MQEDENFGTTISAKFTEVISIDPDDDIWKNTKPVRFQLFGQVIILPRHFTPSVEDVLLKAINNGNEIAILIQWDDPTETTDSLPDKLAIQMPVELEKREKPFFFMGNDDNPVNLWVFDNGEIYDGYANGAGTLVKQGNNHLSGFWKYENGRYTVIFKRALNTSEENDVALELKKFVIASFLVWNGAQGEIGLKCAVSQWYYLVPEEEASMNIWYIPAIVILLTFLIELLIIKRMQKE
jgi:DMSO reductase family type II enzyme heme b subunit